MFGSIGLAEILMILLVVILIFGVGRISKIGGELGAGIRAFKEGLSGEKSGEKKDDTNDNSKPDKTE